MQVKFAYAACGIRKRGEASIGVAAWAVEAPANQTAAIVSSGQTAWSAARPVARGPDKENNKQAASRSKDFAQPDRSNRFVPSRTPASAVLLTRTGRARSSARGNEGTFSASVLPAAQATLGIGATLLAGGVLAGKGMPSALDARGLRVGPRAGSTPACRYQDADFAQHGEGRFRTLSMATRRHRIPDGAVFASASPGLPPNHGFRGIHEAADPYRFFYQYPQCRCGFRRPPVTTGAKRRSGRTG